MHPNPTPREIIDRQLLAYNSRDIEAYCALFAADAVIAHLREGKAIAIGIDSIRAFYIKRFEESPNLHCDIQARTAIGDYVVDREQVSGIGDVIVEVVAIYEVRDFLIRAVHFIWP